MSMLMSLLAMIFKKSGSCERLSNFIHIMSRMCVMPDAILFSIIMSFVIIVPGEFVKLEHTCKQTSYLLAISTHLGCRTFAPREVISKAISKEREGCLKADDTKRGSAE